MLTHDKQKHDNNDNHKHHDKQENLQHQMKQIHGTVMIVTWFALLQLAVWSHYFRSYRYSIVVHIVCVTLICALSLLGCVLIIVAQSMEVIWQQFVHQTVGFFLIAAILPITFLLGLTSRLSTNLSSIQIKNIHRIFGWSIFILSKLPLYSGISYEQVTTAIYFAILDIALTALFWYLKSKQAKMATILTNDKFNEIYHKNNHKAECSSLMQYKQRFNNKCFIFANYLYQIEPLLNYHPGGQYLISNVHNRQVDRFIYGMQSLQTVHNIKPHSHSKNCLNLAYKPICKINIPQVYIQIPNKTICSIVNAYENIQSHMLIVYFKLSLCTVNNGYTSVTQLGRYRALLVNGVTRLYSCVEFLRPSNVRFMQKIMKQTSNNSYSKIQIKSKVENRSVIEMEQKFINQNQLSEDSPLLPLFIKKYHDGQFTQFLLQKLMNSNVQQKKSYITQTRGFGLGLNAFIQDSHKQRIVMFAGGTGLNPYCDMIDLLFKQMLIATEQQGWQNILKQNITLQQNQLNKYEIILYIGVNSLSYIHPITLFQLQSLSKNGLITVYIKSKQAISSQLTLSSLKYVNKLPIYFRFQSAIQKQLNNDRNTKFLICGTNSMVKNLVEKLQQFGVQEQKYRII